MKTIRTNTSKVLIGVFVLSFAFSIIVPLAVTRAVAPPIFEDGFESNDFSAWSSVDAPKWHINSGTSASTHSGVKRSDVKGDTDDTGEPGSDDVLRKDVSTEGYENITLSYWYRIRKNLEASDHVYVEWTLDGGITWNELEDHTAVVAFSEWAFKTFSLPLGAEDNADFGFRFRATLNAATSDKLLLDDIELSGDEKEEEELKSPEFPMYEGGQTCAEGTDPEFVASYDISSTDTDGETFALVAGEPYLFRVFGTFVPTSTVNWFADAGFSSDDIWSSILPDYGIYGTDPNNGAHSLLADLGLGVGIVDWGSYNTSHEYAFAYTPTVSSVQFVIGDRYDDWYDTPWQNQSGMSDNSGSLTLDVYACQAIEELPAPTGSIKVCKIIVDHNGDPIEGTAWSGATFTISGLNTTTSEGPAAGVFDEVSFDAPLVYTDDLLGEDDIQDAECSLTFTDLPLGDYYYEEETVPASWYTPQYNDGDVTNGTSVDEYFDYSGELFDEDEDNDDERNTDSDGHITLTEFSPNRTLIVLNRPTGSVKVCKVIADTDGNIVDGSAFPDLTFSISGLIPTITSKPIPLMVPFGTVNWTTPLTFTDNFLNDNGDEQDAECSLTYTNLPLGNYYYDEEVLPEGNWEVPRYDDEDKTPLESLSSFVEYDSNLFDGDESNDDERDTDSDGHIVLSANRPNRTITILNQMAVSESVLGCTDQEAINYDPEATEDNDSCEYGDEISPTPTPTPTPTPSQTPEPTESPTGGGGGGGSGNAIILNGPGSGGGGGGQVLSATTTPTPTPTPQEGFVLGAETSNLPETGASAGDIATLLGSVMLLLLGAFMVLRGYRLAPQRS